MIVSSTIMFLGTVLLAGPLAANYSNSYRIGETNICVPEKYAVKLPTASPAEAQLYDVSEGYDISVSIDHTEVAQNISAYKEKTVLGGDIRYQGLYLSLYPARSDPLDTSDSQHSLTQIKTANELFIVNYEPITVNPPMAVMKKNEGDYEYWGYCTLISWNDSPKRLNCERENLKVGSIFISYEIEEPNIHIFRDVDNFIKEKFSQWRCK